MPRFDDDDDHEKKSSAPEAAFMGVQKALYNARTVLLFGEIDEASVRLVAAQLLAFGAESAQPIKLFINSPGGHVESGDSLHDLLRFVGAPVKVIGTGWVASAAALIFLGAKPENRYCLPNTRFMLHQPLGGARGKASDLEIEAREIIKMRERINRIIARETGQTFERIVKDTDRNYWLGPEEAKEYGIVTHIVARADEVK
ncbi:MAG: ATP-dependent Clp protease proteolytic subunit [Alphaproteobacteria bacterium]|nr:ATP-dependent Clp protease proteolytic subunit [Alphaproteobacteria bacterium]